MYILYAKWKYEDTEELVGVFEDEEHLNEAQEIYRNRFDECVRDTITFSFEKITINEVL